MDFTNILSLINHLEQKRKNVRDILEHQSITVFETEDFYRGELNILEEVITFLKIYERENRNEKVRGQKISADKMFEKYGYKKEETETEITYIKRNYCTNDYIRFDLCHKEILSENKYGIQYNPAPFTMEELKAINTKVKELGWEE